MEWTIWSVTPLSIIQSSECTVEISKEYGEKIEWSSTLCFGLRIKLYYLTCEMGLKDLLLDDYPVPLLVCTDWQEKFVSSACWDVADTEINSMLLGAKSSPPVSNAEPEEFTVTSFATTEICVWSCNQEDYHVFSSICQQHAQVNNNVSTEVFLS